MEKASRALQRMQDRRKQLVAALLQAEVELITLRGCIDELEAELQFVCACDVEAEVILHV